MSTSKINPIIPPITFLYYYTIPTFYIGNEYVKNI